VKATPSHSRRDSASLSPRERAGVRDIALPPTSASLSSWERAGVRDTALPPVRGIGFIERHQTSDGPLPGGEGGRGDGPHPQGEGGRGKKATKSAPAESPSAILDRAMSLADLGRYDEATSLVEGVIRDVGANARAFFLLGLIAQAAGSRDQAEAHYLKTIYLDAQHDEALLALAMLARRKGDLVAEAGYRRRAERVLARKVVP
jgi:Tfp pilus assembly protein PilF